MPLTTESAARKDKTNAHATTFEHRHFARLAAILADMPIRWGQRRGDVINHFADQLANTNPRFDRRRFLAACGIAN